MKIIKDGTVIITIEMSISEAIKIKKITGKTTKSSIQEFVQGLCIDDTDMEDIFKDFVSEIFNALDKE